MTNQVYSVRYSGAQAGTSLIATTADQILHVYGISLSVPAGQNAQVSIGATQIASTEGSLNLVNIATRGAKGSDMTITSSGAVSVSVVYQLARVV